MALGGTARILAAVVDQNEVESQAFSTAANLAGMRGGKGGTELLEGEKPDVAKERPVQRTAFFEREK